MNMSVSHSVDHIFPVLESGHHVLPNPNTGSSMHRVITSQVSQYIRTTPCVMKANT